ncbi:MAG: NTP transferase domain-containing protein [Lachnospiraceae bacterium]|nr:NTP transferase domain-containing protein [Lachnospiraceae bacterium]
MLKTVILAAGKGTRMESELPKVVHEAMGEMMVTHVINAAVAAGSKDICLVVGHQAELVKKKVEDRFTELSLRFVEQTEQLGTGHAVKCAKDFIGDEGDVMVLCGDTPLITAKTLKKLYDEHKKSGNGATVLTAVLPDATGYGRIIRDKDGFLEKIVEQKDATPEEAAVKEINSGMYVFNSNALSRALLMLNNDNAQGEYYLTDTLEIIKNEIGMKVGAVASDDLDDIKGVNTKAQLKEAEDIMKAR